MTNNFAVAVLPFTEAVLRIDFSGAILRTQKPPTFDRQVSISSPDYTDLPAAQGRSAQGKMPKTPPKGPSDDDRKALAMRTGDKSIYKFYFRSIGVRWFMTFVATTIAGTFCSHFSRKLIREADDSNSSNGKQRSGSSSGLAVAEHICHCISQSSRC